LAEDQILIHVYRLYPILLCREIPNYVTHLIIHHIHEK